MQQSKRLAILKELLNRLTGQSLDDDSILTAPQESSTFPGTEKKRLDILQELLRRLVA